jgi:hypothetical protein
MLEIIFLTVNPLYNSTKLKLSLGIEDRGGTEGIILVDNAVDG